MLDIEKLEFRAAELSDDSLLEIGTLNKLKKISLFLSHEITDVGVASLVKAYGYNIEEVDITLCKRLTNKSLISIAANCPRLRRIRCSQFKDFRLNLTMIGFSELYNKCPQLILIDCQCTSHHSSTTSNVAPELLAALEKRKVLLMQSKVKK